MVPSRYPWHDGRHRCIEHAAQAIVAILPSIIASMSLRYVVVPHHDVRKRGVYRAWQSDKARYSETVGERNTGMLQVAVVEDDDAFAATLDGYIRRYSKDRHRGIDMTRYHDGEAFLEGFQGQYQIVFMDIVMPHTNGLEAARQLRQRDSGVCLIFITSMAQYAICGYEVDALDYVLKPLEYDLFRIKLDKAVARVHVDDRVAIAVPGGVRSLEFSHIVYVESNKHYVQWHTTEGEFRTRDMISNLAPRLLGHGFAAIRASVLVNMAYVTQATVGEVTVGDTRLPVARTYRADFRDRLTVFMAGGVVS